LKTPIVWTAPASANLEEIRGYASGPSSFFGDNQVDAIVDAISTLADIPEMGRLGRRTGTRELVIQGTPYIVA
jgi:toxin ParE1/3/4